LQILSSSPEVAKSTKTWVITSVRGMDVLDRGILRGLTKAEKLGVVPDVDVDVMLSFLE